MLRDEDASGGFKYSLANQKSLDLGIFLNGLPIFTGEVKNAVSGQTVAHAIAQYQKDRDPKEPLFRFGRSLAHFAVDTEQVFMTSTLEEKKARFFPFNQGSDHGAGNPPSRTGISTAYLWREVWTKNSILDLIRRFVQVVDKLYDIRTELEDYGLHTPAAIDAFCEDGGTSVAETPTTEPLSKIIEDLNQQFGTKFTDEDRVVIEHLEEKLGQDPQLAQQLSAGSNQAVRMSFEEVAQDMLHELIESNFKFYKKVQDDGEISKELFDRLFERYMAAKKSDKK